MSHVSDDVLAGIALGDPDVDPADRDHVDSCPVCSEELAELRQVQRLLRDEVGMRDAHRVDPGPQVWERVLAATSGRPSSRPVASPRGPPWLPFPTRRPRRPAQVESEAAASR